MWCERIEEVPTIPFPREGQPLEGFPWVGKEPATLPEMYRKTACWVHDVTIGADSGSPWYETIEAGQVIISQATGSDQDWTVVQEYDLQIGSGLA